MTNADLEQLSSEFVEAIAIGGKAAAIVGSPAVALRLVSVLPVGVQRSIVGVFDDVPQPMDIGGITVRPMQDLSASRCDVIAIAADAEKEEVLLAALPHIVGVPKVLVSGYGHFAFRDSLLTEEMQALLVPSLATGYPHSVTHLYQCLVNAARLGLSGAVAEFGMFKGGTTMLLRRIIDRLGADWPVYGFDTFAGFPKKRSPLDMYEHPGCVFKDVDSVRRYVAGRGIEIVVGDVVETSATLNDIDLVLTFIDTDNYTSAKAALEVVRERTVRLGAIVFDHFTGVDRFKYTLGERIAAKEMLANDSRYFNLHGTGVFFRQI